MGKTAKRTQKAQQKKLAKALFDKPRHKNPKSRKTGPKQNKSSPTRNSPRTMSAVTDGVNVGMVWKNSSQVRDHFNRRFEKVTDLVAGSTAFSLIQSFYLNPANSVLFPVFSQIASTYEEYICHLLRFWYRGEEYMASGSNTSAGIVAFATNMDPDDSVFTNISQLENYEGSVSGPPFSGHFCHDVAETHKTRGRNRSVSSQMALNQYFVYSSANQAAPANSTSKFYDLGQFQVAINGCQAAAPMGELWVEHEWTMIRRKQETPIGSQTLYAHIVEGPAASAAAAGGHYLGTSGGVLRAGSTIPCVSTGTTFSMPIAGLFLVAFAWSGSVTVVPTLNMGANITDVDLLLDSTGPEVAAVSSNSTAGLVILNVSAPGTAAANLVTVSGLTNLAAGTCDIFISQIGGGATLSLKSKPSKQQVEDAFVALCERFDSLEKRLARAERPLLTAISEPDTPCEEIKETDLESSVHISKSAAQQLLRGLGLKK